MWKSVAVLLLTAATAFAQEGGTAYDALRVIGTQMNRDLVKRVISMAGADGHPQPRSWRVLLADHTAPGGSREVTIADGRIVSQRSAPGTVVGSSDGATIKTSLLNLDSSGAYAVAAHTAETSHTVFSTVNYTLRTNDRGYPTWIVTLLEGGQPVGTVHIGANRGTITRVEGMYRGTNTPQVEQEQPNPRYGDNRRQPDNARETDSREEETGTRETDAGDDPDDNIIKRQIKRAFRRTKEDARRMFMRVERSFDRYFYRD